MSPSVINLILQAIDANGEAVFSREDLAAWPKEDFDEALRTGLLEQAEPADEVVCPGCEEACLEDVEFVYGDKPADTRAYVACGDLGRVKIELKALDRWAVNRARLQALGYVRRQHGRATTQGSDGGKPTQIKKPSKKAITCYRVHIALGQPAQEQTTAALAKEWGKVVHQGTVSRWLREVDWWLKAGHVFPEIELADNRGKPKPLAVDPSKLDLGYRTDRKKMPKRSPLQE